MMDHTDILTRDWGLLTNQPLGRSSSARTTCQWTTRSLQMSGGCRRRTLRKSWPKLSARPTKARASRRSELPTSMIPAPSLTAGVSSVSSLYSRIRACDLLKRVLIHGIVTMCLLLHCGAWSAVSAPSMLESCLRHGNNLAPVLPAACIVVYATLSAMSPLLPASADWHASRLQSRSACE